MFGLISKELESLQYRNLSQPLAQQSRGLLAESFLGFILRQQIQVPRRLPNELEIELL